MSSILLAATNVFGGAAVTAFTHVAASYERSTGNTTTKTFTVPAGAQAGDLLVATSFMDRSTYINSDANQLGGAQGEYDGSDPLSGWAFVGSNTSGSEYPEGITWFRVWDGVTSSFTVTWNNADTSAGIMVAFRPDKPITTVTTEGFQESDGPSALSDTISSVTDTNAPGGRIYMYFLTGRPTGSIQNPTPTFTPSTGWTHVDGEPLSSTDQMDYAYKLASAGDAFVSTTASTNDAGRQGQHFFIINAV